MSLPALLLAIYFLVGLVLMIVAMASRGREKRAPYLDASDGTQFGAWVLILIALFWPLWLLGLIAKEDDKS